MDDATIRKLSRRAQYVARKYWHPDEAEDIAQSVLLSYLKNPESKQTVEQVVIDYLRQNGGRTRGGAHRICLLDGHHSDEEIDLFVFDKSARSSGEQLSGFERYLVGFETKDRCIAVLRYVWGLTEKEIGFCLGLTESRISQRLCGLKTRLEKVIEKHQPTVAQPKSVAWPVGLVKQTVKKEEKMQNQMGGVEGLTLDNSVAAPVPAPIIDVSGLVLEQGIPVTPNRTREPSPLRTFVEKMPVGSSFVCDQAIAKRIPAFAKVLKYKFAIRKISEEKARVWRTA